MRDDFILKERDEELRNLFKNELYKIEFHNEYKLGQVVEKIINGGASKFYVSPESAYRRILKMEKGEPMTMKESSHRRRLYDDLFAKYLENKEKYKCYFKYRIIMETINSPAPSFYMSVQQAIKILYTKK